MMAGKPLGLETRCLPTLPTVLCRTRGGRRQDQATSLQGLRTAIVPSAVPYQDTPSLSQEPPRCAQDSCEPGSPSAAHLVFHCPLVALAHPAVRPALVAQPFQGPTKTRPTLVASLLSVKNAGRLVQTTLSVLDTSSAANQRVSHFDCGQATRQEKCV